MNALIIITYFACLFGGFWVCRAQTHSYTQEADNDRVHILPGAKELDFNLFAGNISVVKDRSLFYTLAESASQQPDRDPLVLWLNGGPGCSSLGGGFLSELGPFYPTPNGQTLVRNDFSWNHVANLLFLESPAFVGWSWSASQDDRTVGDARTARDSYTFLRRFLKRFPQYGDRPLWLAGESYAGHYLPNLALEIVQGNQLGNGQDKINFKGFLVGNPWTHAAAENAAAVSYWWSHGIISTTSRDGMERHCNPLTVPAIDSAGALEFWFTHGIISEASYHGVRGHCDFAKIYPLASFADNMLESKPPNRQSSRRSVKMAHFDQELGLQHHHDDDELCDRYINQAMEEFGGINIYDVYADVCLPSRSSSPLKHLASMLRGSPGGIALLPALQQPRYDPCIDNEVEVYFNRPDVQQALHANISGELPGPWKTCNEDLDYSRHDILFSMLPVYDRLLKADIHILVYSGDIDAIVPIIGTRTWIRSLDLEVEEAWRPWRSSTGQVGGWTVGYQKGLRFASVRGAGHMVPYTQPERAFHLFSRWVHGKPL